MPDMEKIANVLQDYLDDYNLINPKEVKLVFFQDAIEHVSRYSAIKCLIIHLSNFFILNGKIKLCRIL